MECEPNDKEAMENVKRMRLQWKNLVLFVTNVSLTD